jgi:hypothetical protein
MRVLIFERRLRASPKELVDLMKFELTTSSMPYRNMNRWQAVWRKTKDLARGDVDSSGRDWGSPLGSNHRHRLMLQEAKLMCLVTVISMSVAVLYTPSKSLSPPHVCAICVPLLRVENSRQEQHGLPIRGGFSRH